MTTMRLPVALGLALVTMADVMVNDEVSADDAWSDEYRQHHTDYLRKSQVPEEVINDLVNKTAAALFALMLSR